MLRPEGQVVPSFNDMVVKACALALREFPRANGAYKDGRFELYSRVNVGVAVAAQDALVVPTVFDADKKGLREISSDTKRLAGRVRDGAITPPELSGGTFTVVLGPTAVILPLSISTVPWTIGGSPGATKMRSATMAVAVPYANAAQLAYPERQVVAFVGDGGFTMLGCEFITAVNYKLPIKAMVIKNNVLG